MTAMEALIPAERLTIAPANEASCEDLVAIFGTATARARQPGSGAKATVEPGAAQALSTAQRAPAAAQATSRAGLSRMCSGR